MTVEKLKLLNRERTDLSYVRINKLLEATGAAPLQVIMYLENPASSERCAG